MSDNKFIIKCDWCDNDADWVVNNKGMKNDYMCNHHYNSHARSTMAKGKRLKKRESEIDTSD